VATELILGFPKDYVNKAALSRHQRLWTECLEGFFAFHVNLPGFGTHCPDLLAQWTRLLIDSSKFGSSMRILNTASVPYIGWLHLGI